MVSRMAGSRCRRILSRAEFCEIETYFKQSDLMFAADIDCIKFPYAHFETLKSIQHTLCIKSAKGTSNYFKDKNEFMSKIYSPFSEKQQQDDTRALLQISISLQISPSLVAKNVLKEFYKETNEQKPVTAQNVLYKYLNKHKISMKNIWHEDKANSQVELKIDSINLTVRCQGKSPKEAKETAAQEALVHLASLDGDLAEEFQRTIPDRVVQSSGESQFGSSKPNKKTTKIDDWWREPSKIPDAWLSRAVSVCHSHDVCYSPAAVQESTDLGRKYEQILQEQLDKLHLKYQVEKELRGLDKSVTPDIKFEQPIEVDGKMVHWIDSKAMFADDFVHVKNLNQYKKYCERFGPGMVIYWFGFIEDLITSTDERILLTDCLPDIQPNQILN